jgi:probable HAF family extracellular repeat protein
MWRGTTTRVLLLVAAAVGCVTRAAALAAQCNCLTDLGPGYGWGLNDSGQAVLSTALYSNGKITPLPLTESLAINASGAAAGTNSAGHAAVYSGGIVTDLGVIPGSSASGYTQATAINASGQVVGLGNTGVQIDAFSYSGGAMSDIGSLPGPVPSSALPIVSEAYGVNDSGQITGLTLGGSSHPEAYHAFIYQSATMTDLGLGVGNAINANGQVTGSLTAFPALGSGNAQLGRAFLYNGGAITDLGVLPGGSFSSGYAINASGQIVGMSDVGFSTAKTHAFFYNGVMTDLNSLIDATDPLKPYVTLFEARGVNVNRLIVANGMDSRTNLQHAYLLQGPWLDIAPGPLVFSSQPVGTQSPAQSVTLTNSGTSPLTLGTPSITGPFAQTNNCGATLAAGGSCAVSVIYNPPAGGDLNGSLGVTSDGALFAVPLAGTTPIGATLAASASSVTAGTPVTVSWNVSPGASCDATGGTAADGWTGVISGSGSRSVTEAAVGDYLYGLICTAGDQSAQAQAHVQVNYPAVTVSLSITISNAGQKATLTWSSSNATSCAATGGASSDGWAGSKPTTGSAVLSEPPAAMGQSQTIIFTLSCTSAQSGFTAHAAESMAPPMQPIPASSGGGGEFDLQTLLALLGLGAARAVGAGRRSERRVISQILSSQSGRSRP